MRQRHRALVLAVVIGLAACSGGSDQPGFDDALTDPSASSTTAGSGDTQADAPFTITVRTDDQLGPISPLIRGMSGVDPQYMRDAGVTVNSWGGNPSSRFNYEIGHAWNAAADWEFRNTNYGNTGDTALAFVQDTKAVGGAVRLAVPTLGWIAKNDDDTTCSFPTDGGGCRTGEDAGTCKDPGEVSDPNLANVPSTPDMVAAWVDRMVNEGGQQIDFIAMDNEPEIWGLTHYDVHPECSTYEEILDKYLTYASRVREVAPDAELLGPVACCWFDYWREAPGTADGDDVDYLRWFLESVRAHDEQAGRSTIDVLDVHYYPQTDVFNEEVDEDTAARRLRSTQSLWESEYTDESWINTRIRFIPRMKGTIAAAYPGLKLGVSEWNFGADGSMNGALAIADTLGIYGREGVYMASYWRNPEAQSPGYFAFKMYGNYDDQGSSFSGVAVAADSADTHRVASYAAIDPTDGHLRVMVINKQPDEALDVHVDLGGWDAAATKQYQYSEASPDAVVPSDLAVTGSAVDVLLPAYSITLLDLTPASS